MKILEEIGAASAFALLIIGAFFALHVDAAEPHQATRVEVLGGQCQYGKVGNHVWYNTHYPHQLDMTSGCGLLGISSVSNNAGGMHLGWRLAYVDMGAARVNAVFPLHDSEQPFHPSGAHCNPSTRHGCIGRGVGEQTARGFSAGAIAEFDVGQARLGAELGLFVYEGAWTVTVAPEAPSNGYAPFSMDWRGYQATPFLGATARYGYLMAMGRWYTRIRAAEHDCGGCSGVAGKSAFQALVGLSVPF